MLVWYVSQAVHGCHASRAEPGLTPLTRETDPRPSILSTFYWVTVHGCHTSRAEPGLTPLTQGIGPRPSILFMCRTYYVGVIPCHISRAEPGLSPLTRGSDPRPSILSMCYCVTMHGCHNMLYQNSGTRARTTHPRNRSSTIDSLYVFCVTVHWCHTMSYQQSRTRAHTTHPRNRPSILSVWSQCMGVIACHTNRAEPGLATFTRGTDHRPSILSMCSCVTVHGCHTMSYQQSGTRAYNTHSRNRSLTIDSLYVSQAVHWCHTMSYYVVLARRNQGSHHSPEESILDHRFSLCVTVSQFMSIMLYQQSRTSSRTTPPRIRSSTIYSLYVLLCHCAWVSCPVIPTGQNQSSHHSPEESILDH